LKKALAILWGLFGVPSDSAPGASFPLALPSLRPWKDIQTDVCKQNRSNAKNENILSSLAAVSHKNKFNAAGNSKKVVQA